MTENQEKELFTTLAKLVSGVNVIQSDVRDIQSDVRDIQSDVRDIKVTQGEHSQILSEHSQTLNLLVSKVDSIADTVMKNDKRLTTVEKDVDDLRGQVH